jgi:RES domain-containing protein
VAVGSDLPGLFRSSSRLRYPNRPGLDIDATSVRGVWVRHIPAEGDPLFRPTLTSDGRWQRGEVVEGFYLASDDQTAWAEWYRVLAELAIPPMRALPRDLWRFDIDVHYIANLSDNSRLLEVGLGLPSPSRDEWPQFQRVGETLYEEGWSGVLYPSAARTQGALSLVLFRTAKLIAGVNPLPPPKRYDEPPTPPRGLQT